MATANLVWTLPVARTDGAALAPEDIASIGVSDDLGDGNGAQSIGSVAGAGVNFATPVLTVGTHRFTVIGTDTTGHVSAPSNVATLTVPATLAAPNPVSDLTATLVP